MHGQAGANFYSLTLQFPCWLLFLESRQMRTFHLLRNSKKKKKEKEKRTGTRVAGLGFHSMPAAFSGGYINSSKGQTFPGCALYPPSPLCPFRGGHYCLLIPHRKGQVWQGPGPDR